MVIVIRLLYLMRRRPPKTTLTNTLCPYPTLFRSPDTQATQSSPEVGNKGVTSTRCRFVTTPGKVVTITAVAAPVARDAASIDVAITGCKFLKALEIFVQPAAILNPVVILLKNCIPTKPLSTAPIVVLRSTPVP